MLKLKNWLKRISTSQDSRQTRRRQPTSSPSRLESLENRALLTAVQFDLSSHFTQDGIRNLVDGVEDATDTSIDDALSRLITQKYATAQSVDGVGLPDDGFFAADGNHPEIQLGYGLAGNGNNVVTLERSESFTITVPQKNYESLHILAASTNGATRLLVETRYTGNTAGPNQTTIVLDWFDEVNDGEASQNAIRYNLINEMNVIDFEGNYTDKDPAVFGHRFPLDPTRQLESVEISAIDPANRAVILGVVGNAIDFVVDTTVDESDGDFSAGDFSLREAVELANASEGKDRITFAAGADGTIDLNSGPILISDEVDIVGNGFSSTIIGAQTNQRTFDISGSGSVLLESLTVQNGQPDASGVPPNGGNIRTTAPLTIRNVIVSGGAASQGAGIYAENASLSVESSTISNNTATSAGGGIYSSGSTLSVYDSTILANKAETVSGNAATNSGGGIFASNGNINIFESTVSGNDSSGAGGGLYLSTNLTGQTATIEQTTISGNSAGLGAGGLINRGGLTVIRNSTVTNNSAPAASGVASNGENTTRTEVGSSIVAGNHNTDTTQPQSGDIALRTNGQELTFNSFVSLGNNLLGSGTVLANFTATGDKINVSDPLLSPLGSDGGSTSTHLPLAGSPALDGGRDIAAPQRLITPTRVTSSTAATDFSPAAELIDGHGLSGSPTVDNYTTITHALQGDDLWITDASVPDYFATQPLPQLIFDLGGLQTLTDLVIWEHLDGLANVAQTLFVEFSVDRGRTFSNGVNVTVSEPDPLAPGGVAQTLSFGGSHSANTVRMTILDNYMGTGVGGDRVGLSEIRFLGSEITDQRGIGFSRLSDADGDGTATVDIGAVELSTVVVDTLIDEDDGDTSAGDLSLREAIGLVNSGNGASAITFASSLTDGGPATITLSMGQLQITETVAINGPGANLLTIDANNSSRVFHVTDSAAFASIAGLTVVNGRAPATEAGGAVLSDSPGTFTVVDSVVRDSTADANGGGIRTTAADIVVIGSTIFGNTGAIGGGLDGHAGVRVTSSLIANNVATTTNRGPGGGGVAGGGPIVVTNSSVVGNSARDQGGGIIGNVTLTNSTVTGNSVGRTISTGGGIYHTSTTGLVINNSIVAGNRHALGPSDIAAHMANTVGANNLIGDASSAGGLTHDSDSNPATGSNNIVGVDWTTVLANNGTVPTLADNGGSTQTVALITGSPAIDAGRNSLVPFGIRTDQRGADFGRILDGNDDHTSTVDIGAFELPAETLTVTIQAASVSENGGETTAIIMRSGDTTNAITVTLTSSDTAGATVPATITIAAGEVTSASFTVSAVDDLLVDGTQAVNVLATANGYRSATDSVNVTDDDVAELYVTILADSVNEDDGATATTATVSRNTPTTNELTVNLASNMTGEAAVPISVTIPVGATTSVPFSIAAIDDAVADGPQTVTITASADGHSNGSDTLIVADDESASLTVNIDVDSVSEGDGAAATTATVTRNGDLSSELVVTLQSDDTTEVTVPGTVTIAAGQTTSSAFTISAVDDSDVDGTQTATISASATGLTSGADTVDITDNDVGPQNQQNVASDAASRSVLPEGTISVPVIYRTLTPDGDPVALQATLISFNLHFDSTALTFVETTDIFSEGIQVVPDFSRPESDSTVTGDDDDSTTNNVLVASYTDTDSALNLGWPNSTVIDGQVLYVAHFSAASDFSGTTINFSSNTVGTVIGESEDFAFSSESVAVGVLENVGNVDGDDDFDANDAFLIQLVQLAGSNTQIDQSKGASSLAAAQIRDNIAAIGLGGDVDGDNDFDPNDSFLIQLVKLAGSDTQIDQSKGASMLPAAQIRANVDSLGGGNAGQQANSSLAPQLAAVRAGPALIRTELFELESNDYINDQYSTPSAHAVESNEFWTDFRSWIDAL